MASTIRIGFLSSKNYLDRSTFSGTLSYMHKTLAKRADIELINLGKPWKPWSNPPILNKWLNHLSKLGDIELKPDCSSYFSKRNQFAAIIEEQLKIMPCDIIFAPVAAIETSCLRTNTPIIYLSDTTFEILYQLYKPDWNPQKVDILSQSESNAIINANQLIYSSSWAAASAIVDYGASPEKVHVIPFGANLDRVPAREIVLQRKQELTCKLLFIGKSWERKGGDIAYQTLTSLLSLGVEAELTVVGCIPPKQISHRNLKVVPYLDKNIPSQGKALEEIFLQSHFLLFPTRADCSPISICEANAFGLPVLTTQVGGISSIIRNGVNGYMLPLSASGEEYAKCIAVDFANYARYQQLSTAAREEYEVRLNWNSWADSFYRVVEKALESQSQFVFP